MTIDLKQMSPHLYVDLVLILEFSIFTSWPITFGLLTLTLEEVDIVIFWKTLTSDISHVWLAWDLGRVWAAVSVWDWRWRPLKIECFSNQKSTKKMINGNRVTLIDICSHKHTTHQRAKMTHSVKITTQIIRATSRWISLITSPKQHWLA